MQNKFEYKIFLYKLSNSKNLVLIIAYNDGLRCCIKLFENNLNFATGPY